jgi:hypothetical protein
VTQTPELIDALVACATPVKRLRPPLLRALLWLAGAALILVLLALGHGMRSDLMAHLRQPIFAISILAALATGALAAVAAFALSLPDRSRWWLVLPLPALAVWISTVGYGCIADWVSIGPDGMHLGETARCFATLLLTSVPLSLAMCVMLRHAALLRANESALMAGLAVAAITSTALSLLHDLDAAMMILVWNLGLAAIITVLARVFGHRLLIWASRLA